MIDIEDIDYGDLQLIMRALAVQAITSPGFHDACARISSDFGSEHMFVEFVALMKSRPEFKQFRPPVKIEFRRGDRVSWHDSIDDEHHEGVVLCIGRDGAKKPYHVVAEDDEDGPKWDLYEDQMRKI